MMTKYNCKHGVLTVKEGNTSSSINFSPYRGHRDFMKGILPEDDRLFKRYGVRFFSYYTKSDKYVKKVIECLNKMQFYSVEILNKKINN